MESNGNGHQFRIEGTQLRVMLRGMAKEVGAVNKLAVKLGITGQYLDCILNGKKQPGPKGARVTTRAANDSAKLAPR